MRPTQIRDGKMKTVFLFLVAIITFIWVTASGLRAEVLKPADPVYFTVKQYEKVEVDNSFAFKMFWTISNLQGANTFFSPLSLNMALGMLYNGTSGNTRAEMVKALGIADFSESEINAYYRRLSQILLGVDSATNISIANSIWYRDTLHIKNSFIETGKKCFDAEVQALDFNNPNAANLINNWCAGKTKNRINNIITNPLSSDEMMYLINAVYFKSKWQKRFDKEKTKLDDFTTSDNQKKKVPMMEQTANLPYYADQYLQCVELPYGNPASRFPFIQGFSMIVILPSENTNINQLIENFTYTKLKYIVDYLNHKSGKEVWLKLPRFKIECELPLNQPVMNVGIRQIFDKDFADFANIAADPLYVSQIKQKTFVEVNEEGTEAAAVTAGGPITIGWTPPEPEHFFANRPFLFLIWEKSTGIILFIGRIDEPN